MLKKRRRKRLISRWIWQLWQFRVKTVIVPIVLGALWTVSTKLSESLEKSEIEDITGRLQTAALISTTAILRRVLNL